MSSSAGGWLHVHLHGRLCCQSEQAAQPRPSPPAPGPVPRPSPPAQYPRLPSSRVGLSPLAQRACRVFRPAHARFQGPRQPRQQLQLLRWGVLITCNGMPWMFYGMLMYTGVLK